jgi:two-component system, LuxR family, response regulator FixJ
MTDKRRVYLIDDEEALRRSAGFLLKTSGYDVTSWASGVAFLKDARDLAQGCALLDVRMPEMDGLDVQRAMVDRGINMPVIILTGHGDIAMAVTAMKQGAVDFLEKPFEKAALLGAIDAAFDRIENANAASTQAHEAGIRIAALTGREREVLVGLAQGLPNKTIAYDLDISPRTVEVHRANLMTKLGVRSLSEALRLAFAAGLGQPDEQT